MLQKEGTAADSLDPTAPFPKAPSLAPRRTKAPLSPWDDIKFSHEQGAAEVEKDEARKKK
ncbi:MAG: hypothetical protein ABH813_01330 [Patescibacteria group bacterium]